MIKSDLRDITLRNYADCLDGRTLVLHSGLKLFKKQLQKKCDDVFIQVAEKLNEELKQNAGNIIYKMFTKYRRSEIKMDALILGYQILMIQKNAETIKHLVSFGWTYDENKTHEMNLRLLAGQIDRFINLTGQHEKDYLTVIKDAEKKESLTIERIITMLNKAIGFNAINMNSSLQEFVAANLEVKAMNKK